MENGRFNANLVGTGGVQTEYRATVKDGGEFEFTCTRENEQVTSLSGTWESSGDTLTFTANLDFEDYDELESIVVTVTRS